MKSFTSSLCLLLLLHLGWKVAVAVSLHQLQDGDGEEVARAGRCLGMLGSTRGAVQGLIGDAAKSKTPAERLQEFRNRVEAVRSLVVPPGLRRAQSPPSTSAGQPPTGLPLFGQPSAGAGHPLPLLPQPSSSGAAGQSLLGQPAPSGADNSLLGQPAPSGAELPLLAPIQRTLADVRSALAPSANGAANDLPVSPFTNKQVAAALSIPEGIMKNTADMLGATRGQLTDALETDAVLGSVHTRTPEAHADEAPADVVAPIEPAADGVDGNNQAMENPHTVIPESLISYIPRIPRPLNVPGVLERQSQ